MHKYSLKDFASRGRMAHVTAYPGTRASGLGRRWDKAANRPREHQDKARPVEQIVGKEQDAQIEGLRRRVGSVGTLYAHAMAIEREAIVQYREFAAHMADYGNDTVAELFRNLADFGTEHAYRLAKKAAGMSLPKLAAAQYSWFDLDAAVPDAHAFVLRMLTPRLVLEIALHAEERAKAFFDNVVNAANGAPQTGTYCLGERGACPCAQAVSADRSAAGRPGDNPAVMKPPGPASSA
jgi:rubrerythrin